MSGQTVDVSHGDAALIIEEQENAMRRDGRDGFEVTRRARARLAGRACPCGDCRRVGVLRLWRRERFDSAPGGSFSLSGVQAKTTGTFVSVPTMSCGVCGCSWTGKIVDGAAVFSPCDEVRVRGEACGDGQVRGGSAGADDGASSGAGGA